MIIIPASAVPEVPVGFITGRFVPVPERWKIIGLAAVPLAVMAGGSSVKTKSSSTLKVTPPAPTPKSFNAVIAVVKLL